MTSALAVIPSGRLRAMTGVNGVQRLQGEKYYQYGLGDNLFLISVDLNICSSYILYVLFCLTRLCCLWPTLKQNVEPSIDGNVLELYFKHAEAMLFIPSYNGTLKRISVSPDSGEDDRNLLVFWLLIVMDRLIVESKQKGGPRPTT